MERTLRKPMATASALLVALVIALGLAACLSPRTAHAEYYPPALQQVNRIFDADHSKASTYKGFKYWKYGKGLVELYCYGNKNTKLVLPAGRSSCRSTAATTR